MQKDDLTEPLEIRHSLPDIVRAMLLAAGLAAIVLPAWEFRHGLFNPGLYTIFFGAILLGAWSIGFSMLYFAVAGDDMVLRFENGEMHVQRKSWLGKGSRIFDAEEIEELSINHRTDSDGPDMWHVRILPRSGQAFETPGYGSLDYAQTMRRDMAARLGLGDDKLV